MATQIIPVPAGTVSTAMPVGPTTTVLCGPAVLAGTMLLEIAPTQSGPWVTQTAASLLPFSYRPLVTTWIRATAATQAGVLVLADVGGANQIASSPGTLISINTAIATASQTAEQTIVSLRIPPQFLPQNFRCDFRGGVTTTNSANVKSIAVRVNGLTGTSVFTSPSLASNANYNFAGAFVGINGATLKGVGAGATGGMGLSTTAYTTLALDYIGNELEVVVTGTKATAGETLQVDSFVMTLQ